MESITAKHWQQLEDLIHRDPGGRGLASHRANGLPLDAGQLRAAAESLAAGGGAVGIVTGFCVILDDRVTAETDGPPGALYLARALFALGTEVTLITDAYGAPLLRAGCKLWGLPEVVLEIPFEDGPADRPARRLNEPGRSPRTDDWVNTFLAGRPAGGDDGRFSRLISIERCGPSHTLESLCVQSRDGDPPREAFERDVPVAERNLCHNMRGLSIDAHTAKTHRLFEIIAERRLPITTIGVADGGNEIGMGGIPWEVLVPAIARGPAARIACRIATDYSLIAGVSNWGAYALAAAVCHLRGHGELVDQWESARQQELIETLVRDAGAVDGVTRRPDATVDGLPPGTEDDMVRGIRGILESSEDLS